MCDVYIIEIQNNLKNKDWLSLKEKIFEYCFSKSLKEKYNSVNLMFSKEGQPYYLMKKNNRIIKFFCSTSKTKGYYVVAISRCEIGVDIELIRNFGTPIKEYFFKNNIPDDLFLSFWTKREAYFKLLGLGINDNFFNNDCFTPFEYIIKTIENNKYICSIISKINPKILMFKWRNV